MGGKKRYLRLDPELTGIKAPGVDSEETCNHLSIEPHVRYNKITKTYCAELRCRCGQIKKTFRKTRKFWTDAETDSHQMI